MVRGSDIRLYMALGWPSQAANRSMCCEMSCIMELYLKLKIADNVEMIEAVDFLS